MLSQYKLGSLLKKKSTRAATRTLKNLNTDVDRAIMALTQALNDTDETRLRFACIYLPMAAVKQFIATDFSNAMTVRALVEQTVKDLVGGTSNGR